MILPIIAYGSPILKKLSDEITPEYPKLKELIANMFETMYNSSGVGLAAPQIGLNIRLFIVDASPFAEEYEGDSRYEKSPDYDFLMGFKKVFINPVIIDEKGDEWGFEEGCLSIPNIREEVMRKPIIKVRYLDENFKEQTEIFDGIPARIIQHEYDHIEGILFTDHLSPLKKRTLKRKLEAIAKGQVNVKYKMKFPVLK
jgi:peptide deformylase